MMDAPHTETWGELVRLVEDKKAWQLRVRAIKDTINMVKIKKKGKSKGQKQKQRKRKRKEKRVKKKNEAGASAGGPESESGNDGSEENEENEEESEEDGGKGGWKPTKPKRHAAIRGRVKCNDGFAMSIQTSSEHASTPRDDVGSYREVEVGYPSRF